MANPAFGMKSATIFRDGCQKLRQSVHVNHFGFISLMKVYANVKPNLLTLKHGADIVNLKNKVSLANSIEMSLIIVSIEFKFEKNLLSDIKDMSEISSSK